MSSSVFTKIAADAIPEGIDIVGRGRSALGYAVGSKYVPVVGGVLGTFLFSPSHRRGRAVTGGFLGGALGTFMPIPGIPPRAFGALGAALV